MDGYKTAMRATLRNNDIQMGDFHNMLISGDWAAIHYDIATISRQTGAVTPGTVMEFVRFQDYGPEMGTRVVEGWAGTRGPDFKGLSMIQDVQEREVQNLQMEAILQRSIPETASLEEKYPVAYPTPIDTPAAKEIRDVILQGFDHWNMGYEDWAAWMDSTCTADFSYTRDNDGLIDLSLKAYKQAACRENEAQELRRVSLDNLIVSGDWAAVHYRTVCTDRATGARTAGDVMQFLHFQEENGSRKLTGVWTK